MPNDVLTALPLSVLKDAYLLATTPNILSRFNFGFWAHASGLVTICVHFGVLHSGLKCVVVSIVVADLPRNKSF